MNIGSFIFNGEELYGVFEGGAVRAASKELRRSFPTLIDLLKARALPQLRNDTPEDEISLLQSEITFLPPIPKPGKIIAVGLNYPKPYPVDGIAPPSPENMILFSKDQETLLGHRQPLEIPRGLAANSFDYEGELAVIIGTTARHVGLDDAMTHVLGYSVLNDGSVRDWQKHSIHAGKNFAGSGAWGPWITTADALPPPQQLELNVKLNGETVQSALGREMIFSVAEQISYASSIFTLQPGDIIATGSPDGTGGSRTPKRYLRRGDEIAMSVSGIGTLENSVG
ncbi:MAG: fumarylacetoacetate hydrolase family protein [Rhizobiaceae bacterium]